MVNNHIKYLELVSLENVFLSWHRFRLGKSAKCDVIEFESELENNLFKLHDCLAEFKYEHGDYSSFKIYDPKTRIIHKTEIKDRIVHTLISNELDKRYRSIFIKSSYACIKKRGIHAALLDLRKSCRKASLNNKNNFWYIKCDTRKFFNNINQDILLKILRKKIKSTEFLWLIETVIKSYNAGEKGVGLPLGNFTSQWFANIYLNELDYFVKHHLKIKFYLRYADDFVFFGHERKELLKFLIEIVTYLNRKLNLNIHEDKIVIKKFSSGIDFIGYQVLPHCVIIRKRIRKKMIKQLKTKKWLLKTGQISTWQYSQTLNSYLGWLKHCNGYKLSDQIIHL